MMILPIVVLIAIVGVAAYFYYNKQCNPTGNHEEDFKCFHNNVVSALSRVTASDFDKNGVSGNWDKFPDIETIVEEDGMEVSLGVFMSRGQSSSLLVVENGSSHQAADLPNHNAVVKSTYMGKSLYSAPGRVFA